MANKPPVFIVGSPRSGTTFLRNVLNRHPSLAVCGETRFFADIYRKRRAFGSLENPRNRRRLVEEYLSTARFKRLGLDLPDLKENLLREATSYPALFTGILQGYAALQGKQRFGEKTPHHAFQARTLCEWYPGAAIIHLVRDPRDVVASLQRMPWAPKSILNNTSMWLLFNRAARRLQNDNGYLLVHYEKLVTQPEQELERICKHLDEECALSAMLGAAPVDGPYSWRRYATGPVTTERLQKWKEELTADDVSLVEWVAGRDMAAYGYSRGASPVSITALARGAGVAVFDVVQRQVEQCAHTWYRLTQPKNLAAQEYWKYRKAWESVFPGLRPKI